MGSLTGGWGRASPRYEFCAPSLDDFRQTIERGESLGDPHGHRVYANALEQHPFLVGAFCIYNGVFCMVKN